MINPAFSSDGDELPFFQHFRRTKISMKFMKAWEKMINVQRHNKVKMCLLHARKGNNTKENQLRYVSFSQKYQRTSGQVLIAFDGTHFLFV